MTKIIQIIPYRRIIPDGVGDYGGHIATQWKAYNGTETLFIAVNAKDFDGVCADGHKTVYLADRTAACLTEALRSTWTTGDKIILHMSAFGYHNRALPFWLLSSLKKFQSEQAESVLLTIFHELYATSKKPWHSSFWISSLQKDIARRVYCLSDCALTPCEKYAQELRGFEPLKPNKIKTLPVFSTIGEPEKTPEFRTIADDSSAPALAIFGSRESRIKIYKHYGEVLREACNGLGIKEIVDIGASDERVPETLGGITVRQTGRLSEPDVRKELSRSQYGVLSYDASRLGKSTIFAAYAAHGLGVLCLDDSAVVFDGLENNFHLVTTTRQMIEAEVLALKTCGQNLKQWYDNHPLKRQIPLIESCFLN